MTPNEGGVSGLSVAWAVWRERVGNVSVPKVLAVVASLAAPWLIHLVPGEGVPFGARLLPLFYAPLLSAVWGYRVLALGTGLAGPVVYSVVTGSPPLEAVGPLLIQTVSFVIIFLFMTGRVPPWLSAPLSYLAAVLVAYVVGLALADLSAPSIVEAVRTSWPALVIMGALAALAERRRA